MLEAKTSRPDAANGGAADDRAGNLKSVPSVRLGSDVIADLDALAEHLRARFVVQVTIDGDHRRTHVYRNAAAAEKAVERAKARGQRAHVTLCQMLPVGVVVGLAGGDR